MFRRIHFALSGLVLKDEEEEKKRKEEKRSERERVKEEEKKREKPEKLQLTLEREELQPTLELKYSTSDCYLALMPEFFEKKNESRIKRIINNNNKNK